MLNNQIPPTEQVNPTPPTVPNVPTTETTPQTPKTPSFEQFKNNIGPLLKDVFGKFYSNKKAFYLVSGAFGLILVIIIAGIIFKIASSFPSKGSPTPTPNSQDQNVEVPDIELTPLQKMEKDLNDLKIEINNLDVKQLPLTPPKIDYKINF